MGSSNRPPWGKTDGNLIHHLAHHCADVTACFEALAELPVIRGRMERAAGRALSTLDIARLAVITFLHDCGKLHPGFQAKGWPEGWWWDFHQGHVEAGAAIFMRNRPARDGQIARNLHIEHLLRWTSSDLLVAAFAHHGRPFNVEPGAAKRWDAVPEAGYDPLAASAELGAIMKKWFGLAFTESGTRLPDCPDFAHLFCGLVSLADWLGSTRSIFPFVAVLDPFYMDKAREKAREAVRGIGLDTRHWQAAVAGRAEFEAIAPGRMPRPAQRLIGEWPLDDQLIILEAETGSGKTEAALWRFARLFEAGKVDSLYFALPTRAAAKQIHGRVNEVIKRLFGERAPEAILAVPGYLRAGEAQGQALPHFEVLWEDEPDEAKRLARWAAENAKRYLAAPIAVGTVDQAMLAALTVKHAHLRSAALSRSLLIIDEVHASDRYMTEVQNHLLKTHLGRGGYAMLMSATLGSQARSIWLARNRGERATPPLAQALAAPYPAAWSRDGCRVPEGPAAREKRVRMELVNSWAADVAATRAIEAARKGAKVLVIRNTVKAARETFEAVLQAGAEDCLWKVAKGPALHHSRFAAEDRALLDMEVEAALSPQADIRPHRGVIVIGTQTLEQSLDICADFLITDLCPVDVLLQRIGRLHRHALPRPEGFEAPQCVVLSPEGGLERFTAPGFENGLGGWEDRALRTLQGVYTNLHACELTRRLAAEKEEWIIPQMNRALVELATHEEAIERLNAELGERWSAYWNTHYGNAVGMAQAARMVCLPVNEPFSELRFPDLEEKIRTRLGEEGGMIRFAGKVRSPFGLEIESITLPAHWRGIACDEPAPAEIRKGAVVFQLGDAVFTYSRLGLMRGEGYDAGSA